VQRALAPPKDGTTSEAPDASRETRHLERSLSERLGAPVRIEHGKKGGRIVIRYSSLDELDGVLAHLR
jgi:ParB family chromosome partitioning protein